MNNRGVEYYLQVLWKRLWLIILISLLGTGVSAYLSYYCLVPQYETFTTLLVGRPNTPEDKLEYSEVLLNQQLVNTYREIARSKTISSQIMDKLDLDYDYDDFRKKVDVTLLENTEIIKIQARHHERLTAAMIANETAAIFIEKVKVLMKIDNIQIIDKAEVPMSPVSPKPVQNMAVGFTTAFMLAVLIVIFRAYMNNKIVTQNDVAEYVGIPVIGMIPRVRKVKSLNRNREMGLIAKNEPKSQYAEAYRTLRTNIHFLSMNKESKLFVITSPGANEGKSTIASNLGYMVSQINRKVLLIDGDLRKPTLNEIFKLPQAMGLTGVLAENIEAYAAIHQIDEGSLYVMPSGPVPPNPSELLLSVGMQSLMEKLRMEYDIILIDTPPLGLVTDSADLAAIADGTIIVCSSSETDIESCNRVKLTLKNLNINILGIVLNKVKTGKSNYYELRK